MLLLHDDGPSGHRSIDEAQQTAVILATGGIGLVRAAYSSGKRPLVLVRETFPSFIERTADVQSGPGHFSPQMFLTWNDLRV